MAVLVRADAVGKAVDEELGRRVPVVCEAVEGGYGLVDEVLTLVYSLFNVHDVAGGGSWNEHGLGGVNHEDGELDSCSNLAAECYDWYWRTWGVLEIGCADAGGAHP